MENVVNSTLTRRFAASLSQLGEGIDLQDMSLSHSGEGAAKRRVRVEEQETLPGLRSLRSLSALVPDLSCARQRNGFSPRPHLPDARLDEGRATITDSFVEHMFRCLDCRACETACPSWRALRPHDGRHARRNHQAAPAHWLSRLMLNHVFPYPWRFHLASRLLQLYRHSGLQASCAKPDCLSAFAREWRRPRR